jgi:hypothetical protein
MADLLGILKGKLIFAVQDYTCLSALDNGNVPPY